jgi:hypothetical protein
MRAIQHAGLVAVVGVVMIGLSVPAGAQSVRIDGGVVSRSTFGFYWETRLEPPVPGLGDGFSTWTIDGPGAVHRIMVDRNRRVVFGYDVVVEPLPEANTYRVAFQQVVTTPEVLKRFPAEAGAGWTQLPTPVFPAAQSIHGGDVLALNLLTNGATGQKIVDYVTVQEPARKFDGFQKIPEREFAFAPGAPRDFRADDAELRIVSPRLSVNGKLDQSSVRRYDAVSGAVVWIYVGNRGRYYLSLMPHPELGFRKIGEVRGSSLSFTVGNDTFTLSSASGIAPGQAPFNLYVLHDPSWRPTYPNANLSAFNMGSADRAESLIRK